MFYDNQPDNKRTTYKEMLKIIGGYSKLFSESNAPYLAYRAHENTFCKYMNAINLAREDCSADAKKDGVGIGLKTWTGNNDQKVAEFGKLKKNYENLKGYDLIKTIAEYRNSRIRVTMNKHNLNKMVYHIVKRVPNQMEIYETSFDYIDIPNIKIDSSRGNNNNTYFSDGKHEYHFSTSKNTLYMIFDDMTLLDTIDVNILEDPYYGLINGLANKENILTMLSSSHSADHYLSLDDDLERICLRLYSVNKSGKFVAEKSGLNQWNAGGRKRDPNELYIPYPKKDRENTEGFFPNRDTPFNLTLPDGQIISAKVCQQDSKAIMSNPNKLLGEWLLRKVFELPEKTIVTYEMLEKFGIDSVIFTKIDSGMYSIDFCEIGTYEAFYGIND